MTFEEKYEAFQKRLNEEVDVSLFETYLHLANQKILNHRFPYGTELIEVEPRFEEELIELTIVLYNQRGAEGQSSHSENGITRHYRSVDEILKSIPRMAGLPL